MRQMIFASAAMLGIAAGVPAVAQGMTPDQYLEQARQAVHEHHTYTALMAVNNAENELLRSGAAAEQRSTRDVGQPAVERQIGRAREAIQQRNWTQADIELSAAMSHPSASTATNPSYGTGVGSSTTGIGSAQ